ncbi:MAG: tetratricopeptide repeat protein, partial [Bryobacteraceae bacterium]
VMVSAPVMVMLYDRAFVSGSLREAWRRHWRLYVALAGSWILLGYLMFFAGSVRDALSNIQAKGISWWGYLATEPGVIVHYLRLSVWPQPLCLDYGWPFATTWTSILPPAIVVVGLLAAAAWGLKKNLAWGFLGAWFFLILAPTSSFFPTDSPRYEHRMYLPLAAVIILGVMGVRALVRRQSVVVFAVVAITFGFLTMLRNEDYRSAIAFWDDAVMKRPGNYGAHNNLGVALQEAGRMDEAIQQLQEAVRLRPGSDVLHYNLGNALFHGGHFEAAVGQYEEALRIKPEFAEAHYSLGVTLARTGRAGEAVGQYEEALRINPDYVEARKALAGLQAGR